MALKHIGYFKELKHGYKNGPSLKENISNKPQEYEKEIIAYLSSGIGFVYSPGIVYDILSKDKKMIESLVIFTDGVWDWPSDLVYYVEKYNVHLHNEFIEHMKSQNWKVPSENEIDLVKLEEEEMLAAQNGNIYVV